MAEGGVPPALTGVHPYQRSVHGLLERIEGEQASGRLHSKGLFGLGLVGEQPGQRLEGQLAQPLPLGREPLLEGGRGDGQALEEVPSIELGGLLEGLRGALAHEPLEREDVDVERRAVQRHPVLPNAKAEGGRGERGAKDEEHLAEIGARLVVVDLGPEQGGQLVAWVGLAGVAGEEGEQGLGLLARDRYGLTGVRLELEAAEKAQLQGTHLARRYTGFPGTRNCQPISGNASGNAGRDVPGTPAE